MKNMKIIIKIKISFILIDPSNNNKNSLLFLLKEKMKTDVSYLHWKKSRGLQKCN